MSAHLCIDCRFHSQAGSGRDDCVHPSASVKQASLVTGVEYVLLYDCDWQRDPLALFRDGCGPNGRFWEPKQPDERAGFV
jgi:hypothetical protein